MILALSILRRDLHAWPRRPRFYLKRSLFVGVIGIVAIWGFAMAGLTRTTTVGLTVFQFLSSFVLFAICILSAVVSGLAIMREKADRTLALLSLTDVSPADQILGRLLSSMFSVTATALSVLPLFILCGALGGVSPIQFVAAFTVMLGIIALGCCVGLLAGVWARTETGMMMLELAIGVVLFLVLPLLASVCGDLFQIPTYGIEQVVSSFVAMQAIARGSGVGMARWNCLFNVAVGLPFFLAACVILPRSVLWAEGSTRAGDAKAWFRRALHLPARRARPVPKGANPVLWKDSRITYGGLRNEWISCGVLMTGVGVITWLVCRIQKMDLADVVTGLSMTVAVLSALVFGVITVVRSARAFNSEKEAHTLELLLLTDLADGEIVRGKLNAILLSSLPWLTAVAVAVLPAVLSLDLRSMDTAMAIFSFAIYAGVYSIIVFSSIVLALFLSLRLKVPAVLGICLLAFVVQNGCCAILDVVTIIVFTTLLFGSFREHALKDL